MMKTIPEQKLISFMNNDAELNRVNEDLKNGWSIVSLMNSNNYYVGIMEKTDYYGNTPKQKVFIPPRKKIKIFSKK